jgi:hypothetical protein
LLKKLQFWICRDAVAEQQFFKKLFYAVVEVLPSSCEIAIADIKKTGTPTSGREVPLEYYVELPLNAEK